MINLPGYNAKAKLYESVRTAVSLKSSIPADGINLTTFLKIAIQLAKELAVIHRQQVTPNNIRPGYNLINPDTVVVKIINFGTAAQLSPKIAHPLPPGQKRDSRSSSPHKVKANLPNSISKIAIKHVNRKQSRAL